MIYRILFLFSLLTSCAYHMGPRADAVPGGVKSIGIPVFKNLSKEVMVETYFTNALLQEFERSKVVQIVPEPLAEATMYGVIKKIEYLADINSMTLGKETQFQPAETVLTGSYQVRVEVELKLIRNGDQKLLWFSDYSKSKTYSAPQVTLPIVNSVNPLYNLSARRQLLEQVSLDLMSEAHDRMLDKF